MTNTGLTNNFNNGCLLILAEIVFLPCEFCNVVLYFSAALFIFFQMGDRVGPVGTGETSSSLGASGATQRLSPVNWSMVLDRQEALVSTEA